ncbi:MAG: DUF167 domain-containing protein [Blastocatellales bacterium]
MVKITAKDSGISFAVRVQPRASRNGVAGEIDGALKIRLAAPPVDGEANEELIRFLAKLFTVSRQQVTIVSGQTSRNKMIRIEGKELDDAEKIILSALDG